MSTPKETSGAHPLTTTEQFALLDTWLPMSLKTYKILKAVFVSTLIAGIAGFAIVEGAEPTTVAGLAILIIGLINGIDWAEWRAAKLALENRDVTLGDGGDASEEDRDRGMLVMAQAVPFKWRNFLTGRDDVTIANVTFLSKPAEWHAVAVGFVVAAPTGPLFDVGAGAWGLKQWLEHMARRSDRSEGGDGLHYKDALNEPAYFALGFLLGTVLALTTGHSIPAIN